MGWGVQTWTLAAMIAVGRLPSVDFIIHADTGHERAETYAFAKQWTPWLAERGCEVVTVRDRRSEAVREDWSNSVQIPAFTVAAQSGKRGQMLRQCTHNWKIRPIRRFVRMEMRRRGVKVTPGAAESLLGISTDELMRARVSDTAYIRNVFPLLDEGMSRADCLAWLDAQGLPAPPKSACTFCPFNSLASWQAMKLADGPDWQEAVAVDESIRNRRPGHGPIYVHPARRPLPEAVLDLDNGGTDQLTFDSCESGYCWV